jgi:hypothetical protein
MAFQIIELALDANDDVIDRKVVPYPYPTRKGAVEGIEEITAGYARSGYDPKHDFWWAVTDNRDRLRFIIVTV